MFIGCFKFNKPLHGWGNKVHALGDTSYMFNAYCELEAFDQNFNNREVPNIINVDNMFKGCMKFNQPVDRLFGSQLESSSHMLTGCVLFNQPMNNFEIHSWHV